MLSKQQNINQTTDSDMLCQWKKKGIKKLVWGLKTKTNSHNSGQKGDKNRSD